MREICHSSTKLIVNDSDVDKAFRSMHQSAVMTIKNWDIKDWIVKPILEHGIKIFEF